MIDPINDELIPLREVPGLLPRRDGKKIHIRTVYRWVNRGVRGKKLETIRVGGPYYTTAEALADFFGEQKSRRTGSDIDDVKKQQSTSRSSRSAARLRARERAKEIIRGSAQSKQGPYLDDPKSPPNGGDS